MFSETVVRLNYIVWYQLYLLGDRVKNRYSANASYFRKRLTFSGQISLNNGIILASNWISKGKNLEEDLGKSDCLYENGLYDESQKLLNQYNDPDNAQILWRQARALYRSAMATNDRTTKLKIISTALQKLKDAVERDEKNHIIHIWLSVFLLRYAQSNGLSSSVFQQMNKAHIHMRRAIELAPDDALSWFTLAHYEYNLADLPWWQRKLILNAFSVTPAATYKRALEFFERAERLKPGFCTLNQLMIAKCHIALNNILEAEKYLIKLANITHIRNEDDTISKESADKLLKIIKQAG